MNMIQIEKMCKNIYADYVGMGHKKNENDEVVLSLIMRQYAQTEIDWEEVRFLWVRFLEKGERLTFQKRIKWRKCVVHNRLTVKVRNR